VDVRVVHEVLSPGVEDGEKGDFTAEIFFIAGKTLERLGDRLEQNRIERLFIPERECVEFFGNGKDDMEVMHGQKVPCSQLDPTGPQQGLTFRAMPVSAGVIGDTLVIAVVAAVDVAAQSRGPARHDGVGDLVVIGGQRAVGFVVTGKGVSENVGNLKSGLVHGRLPFLFPESALWNFHIGNQED
jgi:hypothetical protein